MWLRKLQNTLSIPPLMHKFLIRGRYQCNWAHFPLKKFDTLKRLKLLPVGLPPKYNNLWCMHGIPQQQGKFKRSCGVCP